jgi:hypothetical protein
MNLSRNIIKKAIFAVLFLLLILLAGFSIVLHMDYFVLRPDSFADGLVHGIVVIFSVVVKYFDPGTVIMATDAPYTYFVGFVLGIFIPKYVLSFFFSIVFREKTTISIGLINF